MGPKGRMPRGDGRKAKNVGKTLKRILSYVSGEYKFHIIAVFLCLIFSALAGVAGSLFLKTLIDDYITPLMNSGLIIYTPLLRAIFTMAGIYAVGVVSNWLSSFIMVTVSQGTMKKIRDEMFMHMQKLPVKYFDTHSHGDLMSHYTNDTDTLRQMISQSIPQMFSSVITITSVFCAMLYTSVPLTFMVIVFVVVMFNVAKKVGGSSAKYFVRQQKSLGKINGFIEEMINGQKVVKVFCYEENAKERFDKLNEQLYSDASKANRYANILMPILANIGHLQYVMVAFAGGVLALSGVSDISIGDIASFMLLSQNFTMPVSQVSQQLNSIAMALAGAERIFELMDEEPEFDEGYVTLVNARYDENGEITETAERTHMWAWKHPHKDGTITYKMLEGKVAFDDVDFGYTDEKMVLHNISLYAEPGQKIAFVGATGAGKTTITNLINRFYDIADGKIRYDDININKIKKTDLRCSLGIVLQDVNLFTGTIMENIRYGNLDATDEEVYAAARLANADGFIQMLPQGYDTVIGSEGSSLSQGQRQLISIARAAVADPPVMILDEATSSIDTRTETIVQKGMDRLMQGRTVFVIAHRLSTIQNSDVIMVMDKGRIIERGNHEELISKKGKYYQLYTGAFELE